MLKNKKLIIFSMIIILITIIFILNLVVFSNKYIGRKIKAEGSINTLKATYEVKERKDENLNVLIIFTSTVGIDKITYPDNNNEINCNGKNKVAIDYKAISDKEYKFKILEIGQTEEKIYNLVVKKESQVIEKQDNNYPIVMADRIKIERSVSIDYQYKDNCKNYYSLDDGETWEEYTETIIFKSNGNIKIKTETNENIITPIESKEIKIDLANDALGFAAYDGDNNTSDYMSQYAGATKYMLVDSSAIGKKLHISAYPLSAAYGMSCGIYAIDQDNKILTVINQNNESVPGIDASWGYTGSITIPEKAERIMISVYQGYAIDDVYIVDEE